ncbi:MAG: hypothetical protein ACOC7R_00185 [Planctomycetota bacterium]
MSDATDNPVASSGQTTTDTAGADAPAEPSRDTVSRAELEKVIRQRQEARQRAREAEARLATVEGAGDPDGSDEVRQQLQRKLADRESQLAALLRDEQLRAAAAKAGAINPDQVVGLLRARTRMEERPDGRLAPVFLNDRGDDAWDEDGPPADADAFVQRYLADPANANLLRATSTPGSGAKPVGGAPAEADVPRTLAEFHSLPADRRRDAAMQMTRRQREALLGLIKPGEDGYL